MTINGTRPLLALGSLALYYLANLALAAVAVWALRLHVPVFNLSVVLSLGAACLRLAVHSIATAWHSGQFQAQTAALAKTLGENPSPGQLENLGALLGKLSPDSADKQSGAYL